MGLGVRLRMGPTLLHPERDVTLTSSKSIVSTGEGERCEDVTGCVTHTWLFASSGF